MLNTKNSAFRTFGARMPSTLLPQLTLLFPSLVCVAAHYLLLQLHEVNSIYRIQVHSLHEPMPV
jgi:hypothetical protein